MQHSNELNERLQQLEAEQQAKAEKQKRELIIWDRLKTLTGLDFMVLIHTWKDSENISVWIENNQFNQVPKFDRYKIAEYYKMLCTEFIPVAQKVEVNKVDKCNVSPVTIAIHNNENERCFHHQLMVRVTCSFSGGYTIAFKFPLHGNFDKNVLSGDWYRLRPENGGRMMEKQVYRVAGFDGVNWYGGDKLTYSADSDRVADLMRIAFTGKDTE